MSLEMNVPTVGESITEVTIASWTKNEGDMVEMDEVLCELESDKATFEVTAETSGKLHIKAQEGDVLKIGALLCEIDESVKGKESPSDADSNDPKESDTNTSSKVAEIIEMKVPTVGESITEVTIASWTKNEGDTVEMDEVLCELESDKATFEVTAETSGKLHIKAQEGDVLKIGALLCKIETMEKNASSPNLPANNPTTPISNSNNKTYATNHPSPAATKILNEKGIPNSDVNGTGKDGRITKEDAMNAQASNQTMDSSVSSKSPSSKPQLDIPSYGENNRKQRREKMSSLRKTVSKRLVSVKNETAMLTTFNEVDMKPIINLRKKYKEEFKEKHEVNLGFMSFFTKAVCVALQEWPAVNAQIDGNETLFSDYCDISIAVSAPKGLVVPVIRNAESMSFVQIEKEVVRLATKAKNNKLSIEEMEGGTFTLTNGGIFGSMMSTPIINAPQSAILGMHNIVERAVVENGEVVIKPMMYLALSYDHRIIDGRESVSFLVRVKQLLENPVRLLLGV